MSSKDPARRYKIHKRQEIVETAVEETEEVHLEKVEEETEEVEMVGEETEEELMVGEETEEELMAGMHLRLRNLYRSYPSHIKTFYHLYLDCLYNLQKQHTLIH